MTVAPLVDFLVIGAMKASTTSLLATLGEHPDVAVAATKEAQYFVEEVGWRLGAEWYGSLFDATPGQRRGEASPQYTFFPFYDGVPERIRSTVPDVRLVYLVRDPVERLVSHWRHALASGLEIRPLREAALTDARLQIPSRYWLQLEQYLRHFDEDQVLVVDMDRLLREPATELRRICGHIGVDTADAPAALARLNVTEERGRPRAPLRAMRRSPLGRRVERAARRRVPPVAVGAWEWATTAPNPRVQADSDLDGRLRELFAADSARLGVHLGDAAPPWAAAAR